MRNLKSLNPQPRASKSGPFNVPAPGYEKVDGETVPYRNAKTKDKLVETPREEIATVYDIVKYGSAKYGNARCMGSRKLMKMHHETKKIKKTIEGREQEVEKNWSYFELSGYTYITFTEYEQRVHKVGAALKKLGMQAQEKIEIFASTSANWLATAHGAMSQSIAIVTAYDTLGEEGLKHSLTQTGARAIYLDAVLFPKLVNPLKAAKDIQHVIYNVDGDYKQDLLDQLKNEHPNVTFHSFDDLVKLGEENPLDPNPPSPDDVACVMYTSGSTGTPKGVMLKHRNVVAAIAGVDVIVGPYLGPGDGLLTYLPLAHILEFVFENACLVWGGTMGYGKIRTLSENSVRNCKGDIQEFRPTILVGVPAVWDTIKKGIASKVQASGGLKSNMFWGAMSAKSFLMGWGLPGSGLLDAIVFNKVKEQTGGRLRICMNGGGPIAKDTQQFISMAITPLISGYGLTETAAMGALTDPLGWTDTALGEMPASIEMKLVDFPDAGYHATNQPPQGEIWIRGPPVTNGYLDLESETREAYTDDGWFKTGDIGEFDAKGQLRIIDRKKNLVKTMAGEYIALEKLESLYRTSELVANICVYAAQDQNNPVAIIVPVEAALRKLAESNGIQDNDHEKLIHDPKVNSLVFKQLQAIGKKGGLASFEMVAGVVLAEEEWTPENGFTTAATKINRKKILTKYQKEIDRAYGKK